MKKWLQTLSLPKMITVLCLLGLGVNGLVQVGLQRDMSQKAAQLRTQIAESQQLSGQMKDGLNGLPELRDTTAHMAQTLTTLQTTTAQMNQGLGQLESTVSGIDGTVQALGQSTKSTDVQVQAAEQTAADLQALLQQIGAVNGDVINNLNQMISNQQAINADLEDMNNKTKILPRLGG